MKVAIHLSQTTQIEQVKLNNIRVILFSFKYGDIVTYKINKTSKNRLLLTANIKSICFLIYTLKLALQKKVSMIVYQSLDFEIRLGTSVFFQLNQQETATSLSRARGLGLLSVPSNVTTHSLLIVLRIGHYHFLSELNPRSLELKLQAKYPNRLIPLLTFYFIESQFHSLFGWFSPQPISS